MALVSFLFIGLNVIRLKLSRDHLEKDVRDARQQVHHYHVIPSLLDERPC
jgi:hypothetical protein